MVSLEKVFLHASNPVGGLLALPTFKKLLYMQHAFFPAAKQKCS